MSVALRLSRGGSKKRPFYRIVAADIRSPRDGRYLERLGTYNPMKEKTDPERIYLNKERIKYWLSVGAKPTERVQKFLAKEGLADKPVITKQTKQDKPRKKTLEKIKAKEEKTKAKVDAENAAKSAPPASPEQSEQPKPAEAAQPEQGEQPKPAEAAQPEQGEQSKPAEAPNPEQAKSESPEGGGKTSDK